MLIQVLATGSRPWERLIRRWGVSFLLGEDVLFDAFGDAGALLRNMQRFRVDALKIRHVVVSHDHWDHTAGLWRLLRGRRDITVYICPGFSRATKDRIASFGVRVVEAVPLTVIREGVFSTGGMEVLHKGERIFEQAVVIKYVRDLAVVTGCAHPGIVEIVDTVQRLFVGERVYSVLGGLHLKDSSEARIRDVVSALQERGVRKVAPTHCTGQKATEALRRAYGNDFLVVAAGTAVEV